MPADKLMRDLHPKMDGMLSRPGINELTFDCPSCGKPISLQCRKGGPIEAGVWAWSGSGWDDLTVTPSISNHPRGRNWPACSAHLTITKGVVTNVG